MSLNDRLRVAFKSLHEDVVKVVNANSVIDSLFAQDILTDDDYLELSQMPTAVSKMRYLMSILHIRQNQNAFIKLRETLNRERAYAFLVEKIDGLCAEQDSG